MTTVWETCTGHTVGTGTGLFVEVYVGWEFIQNVKLYLHTRLQPSLVLVLVVFPSMAQVAPLRESPRPRSRRAPR